MKIANLCGKQTQIFTNYAVRYLRVLYSWFESVTLTHTDRALFSAYLLGHRPLNNWLFSAFRQFSCFESSKAEFYSVSTHGFDLFGMYIRTDCTELTPAVYPDDVISTPTKSAEPENFCSKMSIFVLSTCSVDILDCNTIWLIFRGDIHLVIFVFRA